MEINSDHVEIVAKMNEEANSGEVKTEPHDEIFKINTNVFEEKNNFEPLKIIGEKRKNKKKSNSENENKKIKEEFVVFEELDDKHEFHEIEEIDLEDSNNQVIYIK
jgi:hypothetical protein